MLGRQSHHEKLGARSCWKCCDGDSPGTPDWNFIFLFPELVLYSELQGVRYIRVVSVEGRGCGLAGGVLTVPLSWAGVMSFGNLLLLQKQEPSRLIVQRETLPHLSRFLAGDTLGDGLGGGALA